MKINKLIFVEKHLGFLVSGLGAWSDEQVIKVFKISTQQQWPKLDKCLKILQINSVI